MIVDITKSAGSSGQIEYVYTNDERLAEDGIWYDLTNSVTHMTTNMVFRRIPAGSFLMGAPTDELGYSGDQGQHHVTLTKDFYMSVFEVTQWQYTLVYGYNPSFFTNRAHYATRPIESVSHKTLRGSTLGKEWPTNNLVDATSYFGKLQTRTGIKFDLATEAQWEYACRSGTTGALNDGTINVVSTTSDPNLDLLGRYAWNGGKIAGVTDPERYCTPEQGTAKVGSYQPNAWGLFDMHGNVEEWTLDWYFNSFSSDPVVDPLGPVTYWSGGTERVWKSGGWKNGASTCCSAHRTRANMWDSSPGRTGVRVVLTLP